MRALLSSLRSLRGRGKATMTNEGIGLQQTCCFNPSQISQLTSGDHVPGNTGAYHVTAEAVVVGFLLEKRERIISGTVSITMKCTVVIAAAIMPDTSPTVKSLRVIILMLT